MRIVIAALALCIGSAALAQDAKKKAGFTPPAKVEPEAYPLSSKPEDHTTAEVKKTTKTGRDTFVGSYVTVDKTCVVGKQPQGEFITQPANGSLRKRRHGFNLTQAPGIPRNKCLGVSPEGIAVGYLSKPRYKGEDSFSYKVIYPDGRTRTVTAAVTVQ